MRTVVVLAFREYIYYMDLDLIAVRQFKIEARHSREVQPHRSWRSTRNFGFARSSPTTTTFRIHPQLHKLLGNNQSTNTTCQHNMPGAGKQPPEVQEHIKELLEAGFDPTTIHRRLKVGRSSIYRMKRCLQQHGTPYMPLEMNKKNGRPKVLTAEQELVCS